MDQKDSTEVTSTKTHKSITRTNIIQACAVYASIGADIFATAYTDPVPATDVLTHLLLLRHAHASRVQKGGWSLLSYCIFLLLAIILSFFVLTTSLSPFVQLGLYDNYFKQHRSTMLLSLTSVVLVAGVGAYRLVLIHQRTPVELWAPGYTAGWVLQRLCLLLLQCRIAYATATSFRTHRHEVESLKANRPPGFQGLHQ